MQNSRGRGPAGRKEADEARLRARREREAAHRSPGPGAYDSHKIRTDGTPVNTFEGAAAAGRQTASFASKTKKLDSKPIGHDVPGVGAYDPKSPRSRTVGGDSAFKSKVDRLAKERIDGSTTAEVGPGSYQTDITRQGMPVNPFDGAASEGNGFGTSAFADTAVRDTTASLFPGDSRY